MPPDDPPSEYVNYYLVPPSSEVTPGEKTDEKPEDKLPKKKINWTHLLDLLTGPCVKHHSVTHVANGTYNDIWVLCDGDRKYINQMNANFSSSLFNVNVNKSERVYYEANSVGFTRIKSGTALAFELHHNGIIYVSIRECVGNGYRTVCDCFPIRHDQSVIVSFGGYICKAIYQTIWKEQVGDEVRNHFPTWKIQPKIIRKTEEPSGLPSA